MLQEGPSHLGRSFPFSDPSNCTRVDVFSQTSAVRECMADALKVFERCEAEVSLKQAREALRTLE